MKQHLKPIAILPPMIRTLLFSLMFLYAAPASWALDSDRSKPIEVNANKATLDDKRSLAIYEGNVELTQGTLRITADKLTIKAGENGEVEEVVASGQFAEFTQVPDPDKDPVTAKAEHILYQVAQEKIILTRSASVVQNNNLFQGNKITYDIKQQKLSASGPSSNTASPTPDSTGRVKVILTPPASNDTTTSSETNNSADKNEQTDSVPSSKELQE